MTKLFEQFDLFEDPCRPQPLIKGGAPQKNTPFVFPNILVNSLTETDARTNAVYYLRIINKSSQKRLFKGSLPFEKKIFFNSLFNEIKLKKGLKNPAVCCREAILQQTILLAQRK